MINDNKTNYISNINEAINLLKNKIILISLEPKTLYIYQNEKIIITNVNLNISLSLDEFKTIYEKTTFYIYENDDEKFDFSRDDEYYNWKHK